MTAVRPTGFPTWCATGATNLAQPDGTHQNLGWGVGEAPPSSYFNFLQQQYSQWIQYLDGDRPRQHGWSIFGNGVDGVATLTGATLLARDMYYQRLNIASGATMCTANYKVRVSDTLNNAGTIHCDGPMATGITGALAVAAGSMLGGASGGNGRTGAGFSGASVTFSLGGAGGTGGAGAGGAAGFPGAVAAVGPTFGGLGDLQVYLGYVVGSTGGSVVTGVLAGGAGGGGGSGNIISGNTGYGGGGGAGGGIVNIAARTLVNTGTISARGGAGATGLGSSIQQGGGGGGGGGAVLLVTFDGPTGVSGVVDIRGGAGGSQFNGGINGSTGATGTSIQLSPSP